MKDINLKNRLRILNKSYLRYLIVKFRQKISFIAFKYKMTIVELFLHAIIKSYNQMVVEGILKVNKKRDEEELALYDKMMGDNQYKSVFISVMQIHMNKVKGTDLFDVI